MNYALLSTVAADRLTQGDNQRMEEVGAKGVRLGPKPGPMTYIKLRRYQVVKCLATRQNYMV